MNTIFTTNRIKTRQINISDIENMLVMNSDAESMRYVGTGKIKDYNATRISIQKMIDLDKKFGYSFWACELKSNNKFIGWAGLKNLELTEEIELGFRFAKEHWNNGYATEVGEAIIKYAFTYYNFNRLMARVHKSNVASQKVLKNIGMILEKTKMYNGEYVEYYSIVRD